MSAWIVGRAHIDAIITTAVIGFKNEAGEVVKWVDEVGPAPLDADKATAMGQTLWRANHRSVNARYGESTRTPQYHYSGKGQILTIAELAKQISCLDYQSCEYDEWYTSKARRFLDKVEHAAWKAISHHLPGYDAAPWGID